MKSYYFFDFMLIAFFLTPLSKSCQSQSQWKQKYGPVLELQPRSPDGDELIWYKPTKNTHYWINELDKFLKPYLRTDKPKTVEDCPYGHAPSSKSKVCNVEIGQQFAPCIPEYSYGYDNTETGPCIFLTISKLPGWIPRFYNTKTVPKDMPKHLQDYVAQIEQWGQIPLIYLNCDGESAADRENLGSVVYYPRRGFPGSYFPYNEVDGYLSPYVAVFLEKPRRGVLINVVCTMWAANIPRDKKANLGMLHFELLVD